MPELKGDLQVGDVVVLKSGGPMMTVEAVLPSQEGSLLSVYLV